MSGDTVTGEALQFTNDNKHAYAYSGIVSANGSNTTALDFNTNSEYLISTFYYTADADALGANYLKFTLKFNNIEIMNIRERRDLGQITDLPFTIIIPPFTRVEAIFPNNGTAADLSFIFTAKVGMPQRVGNLDD